MENVEKKEESEKKLVYMDKSFLKQNGVKMSVKKEFTKPTRKEYLAKSSSKSKEDVIKQYEIETEGMKIIVKIIGGKEKTLTYHVTIPQLGPGALALLDEIKQEITTKIAISGIEFLDPKIINKLKDKFRKEAVNLLVKKIPGINIKTQEFLVGILLHEMLGLGKIEFLLSDANLEEIVVNSEKEPVRVYHKEYGWLETNITVESEAQIQNYSNIIARRVGRQITILNPLLDAHLITGDRANAVLYPISTKGNSLTIRMFARDPWSAIDLIKNKTCTSEVFALLWLAIQYEMTILISGGTASGKTTLLNVCMPFIPPNHRLVSIEQTRELQLPKFLYWCPMVTRLPNPEGKGEVTMLDLLINSLRMRPDRIILGEIRRKEEAEVLFEAMHTGHSVYATVHADSIGETIQRLVNPPIEVPPNLLGAVNLNVVMFRDRRRGLRRVYQVGEFITGEETEKTVVRPNILYRWKPSVDKIIVHANSLRLFEELCKYTGLSQTEINEDLKIKKMILDSMTKKNIRSIEGVGEVMKNYYLNPESVIKDLK